MFEVIVVMSLINNLSILKRIRGDFWSYSKISFTLTYLLTASEFTGIVVIEQLNLVNNIS